ncbi:hypothetical protein GCM10010211_43980 [Streptomyces albospinus]|uniref:Integral membrane protein n=1 Tax=Streptomyces albospinus TaxID=285515 RepID=A0ABQ2V933_9ACTN|nr:hypothetical protein [Streptomyces albospinus]GGU73312.1 hypothetical protein GCM10010211_43980 [Streptomyces albospinus]
MDASTGSGDHHSPRDDRPLNAAEREEYERLRGAASVHRRRLRYASASILLILAFLLAPLAVVATWLNNEVTDTGRYVETVAPLASEPAVQNALTDRLTNRVVNAVDVPALTASLARALDRAGAPPLVVDHSQALTEPLKNALTSAVHTIVAKVVKSDQFRDVWRSANRVAHENVVNVLTGEGNRALQAKGDTIVLNIGTVVDHVKQRLADHGYRAAAKIPDIDRTIPLLQVSQLNKAQSAMRLLDIVGNWLPVSTIALAALAVRAAPAHRVTLMTAAIGIGIMMVALLIGLAVARQVYLDSVPPTTLPRNAAAAIYDTLVRFLRLSTRTVLVVAVITALAGYLYGPGRGARFLRTASARGTGSAGRALARAGLDTGAFGRWLDAHRRWTTGVVIAAGALALFLWNLPTPGVVALALGIVVLALILLGILAAAGTRAPPAAAPPAPGGAP